ncbi:MAG: putative addiction module antidote protein [Fibrobacteres bacterium]|nr:putative addiction module antidote protein [Fibrobacterota bacterium]
MKTAKPLDISAFLDSEEKIAAYLTAVMEDNDLSLLLQAIGHVAKARGMATIAKDSGLGRESLYKAFTESSQPKFDTINRVLNAMNISIQFAPITDTKKSSDSPVRSTKRTPLKSGKRKEAA